MKGDIKYNLTERELDVLKLKSFGWTSRIIADTLGISYHTVKTHAASIRSKFQVHYIGTAIAIARSRGLVE